jgi:hypothetical protein
MVFGALSWLELIIFDCVVIEACCWFGELKLISDIKWIGLCVVLQAVMINAPN